MSGSHIWGTKFVDPMKLPEFNEININNTSLFKWLKYLPEGSHAGWVSLMMILLSWLNFDVDFFFYNADLDGDNINEDINYDNTAPARWGQGKAQKSLSKQGHLRWELISIIIDIVRSSDLTSWISASELNCIIFKSSKWSSLVSGHMRIFNSLTNFGDLKYICFNVDVQGIILRRYQVLKW